MGKALVICETRAIADAVSRALGGRFAIEPTHFEGAALAIAWSDGALVELAGPEAYDPSLAVWRLEDLPIVPERFQLVVRRERATASEQLKVLRTLMRRRDVDRLVNAFDPGPEGELAFAYLLEATSAPELPVERAWLESLARPAVRRAFAELSPVAEPRSLEDVARTRAEADWLVGVNGTRAATVRARALGGRVTIGRVLTPALALLVQREREIEAFTPSGVEVVDAAFEPPSGSVRYLGRWAPAAADDVGPDPAGLEGAVGAVDAIAVTREDRPPPPPYDLAALQRAALELHGMSARRTAIAAYECYEQAALTYPGIRGAEVLAPVDAPGTLGDDARRVHELVVRRTHALTLPPAVLEHTVVTTVLAGRPFRSRGVVLREAGWYADLDDPLAGEAAAHDDLPPQELPELRVGLEVRCARSERRQRETSPPTRLDEAALASATHGAADAATIDRLIQLGYAVRDGHVLRATEKGAQTIDLIGAHAITSLEPLLAFEDRLRRVARGEESRDDLMRDTAEMTRGLVDYLRELPEERTRFPRRDLGIVCPRCGDGTLIENRKGFGCSTWTSREEPGCGFVIWKTIAGRPIDEEIVRELVATGRTRELAGFRSRAGRPFRAALVLAPADAQPVTFAFGPTGRTRA